MRHNCTKAFFIMLCASWLLTPSAAWSMDLNQFYPRFVETLKELRYTQLEQLVRKNPDAAQKSLEIIRRKVQEEKDSKKRVAYAIVVRELEELIAVAGSRRDCVLSARITQRGQDSGIPEEALEAFRRAAKLCPGNVDALLGLAEANKRLGRFEEAVAGFDKVLAIQGDSPEVLLGMGEVLYAVGLYRRSLPFLEKTLDAVPENKKARALLTSSTKQIELDTDAIIPSDEIVARLRAPLEGGLMCMCPMHAQLIARIRFRSITFSSDSTRLDPTAQAQLSELAVALKTEALTGGRFLIEGHADPWGAKEYNKQLSARRAETVKRYLVDVLKVDSAMISVDGAGASRSWTTNETRAGRRANRRIEIISISG